MYKTSSLYAEFIACTRWCTRFSEIRVRSNVEEPLEQMCMRASVSRKWKPSATMFRGHLDALHDESILISLLPRTSDVA